MNHLLPHHDGAAQLSIKQECAGAHSVISKDPFASLLAVSQISLAPLLKFSHLSTQWLIATVIVLQCSVKGTRLKTARKLDCAFDG